MWVFWALIFIAVLGWLGYAWSVALVTKYRHTRDSVLVFLVLSALSVLLGHRVANQIAPAWSLGPKTVIAAGVAFTAFTLFSYIAVNIWCSLLTRGFDEKIAFLEEDEDAVLRRLDALRWRAIRQAESPVESAPLSGVSRDEVDKARQEERILESWEHGGGAARIRSLKVLEWREEIAAKPASLIKEKIGVLEDEMKKEGDESKKEQVRARLSLLRLSLREKEEVPREESSREDRQGQRMPDDEVSLRERLQTIHSEIQGQRTAKAEFMRQRIRLSWRGPK